MVTTAPPSLPLRRAADGSEIPAVAIADFHASDVTPFSQTEPAPPSKIAGWLPSEDWSTVTGTTRTNFGLPLDLNVWMLPLSSFWTRTSLLLRSRETWNWSQEPCGLPEKNLVVAGAPPVGWSLKSSSVPRGSTGAGAGGAWGAYWGCAWAWGVAYCGG
jgi:hypothetical protein